MNTKVVKEAPVLSYRGTICGGCNLYCPSPDIDIYAKDLKKADVGKIWRVEDFDRCPNAEQKWDVTYEVVYKNKNGVAVLYTNNRPWNPEQELIWIELAK